MFWEPCCAGRVYRHSLGWRCSSSARVSKMMKVLPRTRIRRSSGGGGRISKLAAKVAAPPLAGKRMRVGGGGSGKESAQSLAKASPSGKSLTKELDASEQVILSVTQFKGHVADNSQFMNISMKQYSVLVAKADARLSPQFTRLYIKDFSGGSSATRGVDM